MRKASKFTVEISHCSQIAIYHGEIRKSGKVFRDQTTPTQETFSHL